MPYTANAVWMFPPNWASGVLERLEWKTDVLVSETGHEQRIPKRLTPRRSFEASFLIQNQNRQYFQHQLAEFGSTVWLIPVWHQVTALSAPIAGGGAVLTLDTRWREYTVGGKVILRDKDNAQKFEVGVVLSMTDSSLTLVSGVEVAWPARTLVYPAALARLDDIVPATKKLDNLFEVRGRFSLNQRNVYSGDTPIVAPFVDPVLILHPDDSEDLSFSYQRALLTMDNMLGIPDVFDPGQDTAYVRQYRWSVVGREENHKLRQLLYYLRGRAKVLWIPTFMSDLSLASGVTDGATTLQLKNAGYHRTGAKDNQLSLIAIERMSGVVSYHEISASSETSPTVETVTLVQPVSAGFSLDQLKRISFLMKARLDQDSVELNHSTDTDGLTQVVATFYGKPGDKLGGGGIGGGGGVAVALASLDLLLHGEPTAVAFGGYYPLDRSVHTWYVESSAFPASTTIGLFNNDSLQGGFGVYFDSQLGLTYATNDSTFEFSALITNVSTFSETPFLIRLGPLSFGFNRYTNKWSFALIDNPEGTRVFEIPSILESNSNEWNRLAVVHSGNTFTFYREGAIQGSATYSGTFDPAFSFISDSLYVGGDDSIYYDEVRLHHEAIVVTPVATAPFPNPVIP